MNFDLAEQQTAQLQQQSQEIMQQIQALGQRLLTEAKDPTTGRELAIALRAIAMSIQSYGQTEGMIRQQMAQYIQMLEQGMQSHPQPPVATQGWANGMGAGGGFGSAGSAGRSGFLGNLVSGLGVGAGFGIAENVVNDIFNAF